MTFVLDTSFTPEVCVSRLREAVRWQYGENRESSNSENLYIHGSIEFNGFAIQKALGPALRGYAEPIEVRGYFEPHPHGTLVIAKVGLRRPTAAELAVVYRLGILAIGVFLAGRWAYAPSWATFEHSVVALVQFGVAALPVGWLLVWINRIALRGDAAHLISFLKSSLDPTLTR